MDFGGGKHSTKSDIQTGRLVTDKRTIQRGNFVHNPHRYSWEQDESLFRIASSGSGNTWRFGGWNSRWAGFCKGKGGTLMG